MSNGQLRCTTKMHPDFLFFHLASRGSDFKLSIMPFLKMCASRRHSEKVPGLLITIPFIIKITLSAWSFKATMCTFNMILCFHLKFQLAIISAPSFYYSWLWMALGWAYYNTISKGSQKCPSFIQVQVGMYLCTQSILFIFSTVMKMSSKPKMPKCYSTWQQFGKWLRNHIMTLK